MKRRKLLDRLIAMAMFGVMLMNSELIVRARENNDFYMGKEVKFISVETDGDTVAAIAENGDLFCWGDNNRGQVGNGSKENQTTPIKVLSNVESVSVDGWNSMVAITKQKDLYCWGLNYSGQIGIGNTIDQLKPVKVLSNVKSVCNDSSTMTAITEDGDLYCWGYNAYGQIGNGSTKNQTIPVKILSKVKYVNNNNNTIAAITEDGDLYCWGYNAYGQIGNGSTENQIVPIRILENIKTVDNKGKNMAAVTEEGDLYCWGYNAYGQIGNGSIKNQTTPIKILSNIQSVGKDGKYNMAAVTEEGDLYCWGYNAYGQIGDGSVENQLTPKKVLNNIKSIGEQEVYTTMTAISKDGELYCWGANGCGQVGNDSIQKQLYPVKVMQDIKSVNYALSTMTAITKQNILYCWGANGWGQLGIGYEGDAKVPVKVLDNIVEVRCCIGSIPNMVALSNIGEVYCWGYNGYGQVGDGTITDKNTRPYKVNCTYTEDINEIDSTTKCEKYILIKNEPLNVNVGDDLYVCVELHGKGKEQVMEMYQSLNAECKDDTILNVDLLSNGEFTPDDYEKSIVKVICIKGLKPGTTDIEFSTNDRTSTTCTVTVEKNEQEVKSDSYGKIEYAPTNIGNVYSATQQYIRTLDDFYSITRNKMLTDRKGYNNQANYKELRAYDETAKERGTNRLLTFSEMVPDEAIDDAYEVLYEFLKECMKVGIEEDFIRINTSESTVKIEAKIINKIYDAIKKESNTFQGVGSNGYVVELTKTGIFGASFGTVTISGRKKSGMYSGAFCSSKNVVSATMNRFVDELSQEVKELYKEAAISLWNDFMRKSQLRDVTDEMFKSYLEDKTDYLLQRGYGKLLDTMLNNKRGYTLVNDIVNAKTVKDAYNVIRSSDVKSLYNDLSKMKHTDKEIKDATIKNAMKNLEEARQKLQSALFDYLYNDNTYGSMNFGEKVNYKWKTVIQCPVNVEVYNARGRLIGYIRDGEVVYNNEIYLKLDGDVKTIYFLEDKEYYYKLIGTADGIMNCVVEKLDKGEPIARNNYYNVPLAKGIEYTQTIEKNSVIEGTQDIPLIKTDGKSVYADQYYEVNDKNANVAIVGDVVGRGNILGTGKYVIGDSVELDAVAENGYRFEGWYVNDTLVEIESIYRFTAKKNIKVTAKFNKIQQASTKYEVQLETYYKENANVLVYDNGTNAINIDLALYDTEDAQSYKLKLKQWDVQGNQYAGQKVDLLGDGGFHYILEKYSTQGWNSIDLLDSSDMVIATIKKIGENMDNDKEKTVDKEEPPNADAGEQKKNGNSGYNVQQEDVQTTIVTVPKVAKLKKVKIKATKKGFSLKWKRMKNISGYQVQYSIRKNFNVSKTKILKTKAVNYRAKKLKSKRRYYVRIRAYKEYVDGTGKKMAYGKWKIVSTKTK